MTLYEKADGLIKIKVEVNEKVVQALKGEKDTFGYAMQKRLGFDIEESQVRKLHKTIQYALIRHFGKKALIELGAMRPEKK